MIYLDAGATTLEKPVCVREAMAARCRPMTSPGRGGHQRGAHGPSSAGPSAAAARRRPSSARRGRSR